MKWKIFYFFHDGTKSVVEGDLGEIARKLLFRDLEQIDESRIEIVDPQGNSYLVWESSGQEELE